MDLSKIHCLTVKYPGLSNVLACSIDVLFPKDLLSDGEVQASNTCIAIWDTGATGSAITELTAKKLNLVPTGKKDVSGLGGTIPKNTYIVDIIFPNKVRIPNLSVTEIDNPKDKDGNLLDKFGVLIGMDIISMGDFTITNFEGKTMMTFRIPSMCKTDYTDEWNRRSNVQQRIKRR